MKRFKFIYNPVSGYGMLRDNLDLIVERFQRNNIELVPYKLLGKNDVRNAFGNFKSNEFDGIIAAGGDGTLHEVINEIKCNNFDLPLGVIPAGTSNDFANYLDISKNLDECIDVIINGHTENIDVGQVNEKYFINIVAGGILSSIAHNANRDLKNLLGMTAYYLKALEELPNVKPFKVKISYDGKILNEEIMMFMVLNTSIAGGFKVAPNAMVNDGKFDVFIIKNCNIPDFGRLFIKLLKNEHIDDDKVIYFQTDKLKIDSRNKIETDIDGEKGLEFPLEIKTLPTCIRVFK